MIHAAATEMTHDGAPPFDLVDGDLLADKFKEFELGLQIEMIEKVTVEKVDSTACDGYMGHRNGSPRRNHPRLR